MAGDKQKAKIKSSMETEIKGLQDTADILSGKGTIGTSKLNSSKKQSDPFAKIDDPKNLAKFINFMEAKYSKSLIKIQIKKETLK
jgi:hypothetical protein